jgi:hypothetical protein
MKEMLVIAWCLCGIFNYAATLAYFQGKYALIARETVVHDRTFAVLMGIIGPIGLLAGWIVATAKGSGPRGQFAYGLRFW